MSEGVQVRNFRSPNAPQAGSGHFQHHRVLQCRKNIFFEQEITLHRLASGKNVGKRLSLATLSAE